MVASIDISELVRIGESLTLEYKSSFDRESIETLVELGYEDEDNLLDVKEFLEDVLSDMAVSRQ